MTYTIVGVVKDCHYGAPTLPIPHTGFLVGEQMGLRSEERRVGKEC